MHQLNLLKNNRHCRGRTGQLREVCRLLFRRAWIVVLLVTASGCASFGKGIVQGILDRESEDTRACHVDGVAFRGIAPLLERQASFGNLGEDNPNRPEIKMIYVHGMGTQQPGHAAVLREGLAPTLGLTVRTPRPKRIELASRDDPSAVLGELNVLRLTDPERTRELIFYEVTWSPITARAKASLAFDESNIQRSRRASLNQTARSFSNDTLPDALAFTGNKGGPIRAAVGQALCWATSRSWSELPDEATGTACRRDEDYGGRINVDDFVIITHSLGSRVALDTLQEAARQYNDPIYAHNPHVQRMTERLRDKEIYLFMLSNQLPLLEVGQDPQEITGQRTAFCAANAPRADERFLKTLHLVAFSDPNDILSYPVPHAWADRYLDSRLCLRITNVTLNVAPVRSLFGLGELANPLIAHKGYAGDERVRGLLARGAGNPDTAPIVQERCSWTETDESLMQ